MLQPFVLLHERPPLESSLGILEDADTSPSSRAQAQPHARFANRIRVCYITLRAASSGYFAAVWGAAHHVVIFCRFEGAHVFVQINAWDFLL